MSKEAWRRGYIPPEIWKRFNDGKWHSVESYAGRWWVDGELVYPLAKEIDLGFVAETLIGHNKNRLWDKVRMLKQMDAEGWACGEAVARLIRYIHGEVGE